MTNPTANDAAGVSQETAKILHDLELAAMSATNSQKTFSRSAIDAAIDRLIVLDHAAHPRESALHQDAKRGNFRQEDDGA